jgi:hypothetical protein
VGDGVEGRRILVVYARVSSDPDEYSSAAPEIRKMAATVNGAMRSVAGKDVRWHCSTGDTVTVERIIVQSHRISACRVALHEAGQRRTDRLYVCFMRTSTDGFNGQAEIVHDADAKVSPSPHDAGPRYSAIYSLSASSAGGLMHELGHLLGAVQCSAPHTSCPAGERGHHHCYEEQDIMCLEDGGSYFAHGGEIVDRCPDATTLASRWDCGRDDYFSVDPAPGSYLATHWNTYDSLFLEAATDRPARSPEPVPAPAETPAQTAAPTPTQSASPGRRVGPGSTFRSFMRVTRGEGQGSVRR